MTRENLPKDSSDFLVKRIGWVAQLELLLMYRDEARAWSIAPSPLAGEGWVGK
ncbi:MAG: hypothetical protein ACR2FI_01850 [Burkholderiales bacterium]|nr:hypothetical protein [Burkholderiales bacterium]MDQ3195526.1 hypothetical protein [Pseudomonadota bacterium]